LKTMEEKSASLAHWWSIKGSLAKIIAIIAITMTLYHVLFIGGIFAKFGIYIMSDPHRGLCLAFVLALTFLIYPAKKGIKRKKIVWYDVVFLILGLPAPLYYFFCYDTVIDHIGFGTASTFEVVLFFMMLLSLLEAGRRTLGPYMPLVALFFVIYAFTAGGFPGILQGNTFPVEVVVQGLFLNTSGVFGIAIGVAATIVIVFMLFAQLLISTGAGKFFVDFSMASVGRFRGGPAKAAVVGSSLMGTISGSPAANVATTGSITIPLMKRTGFSPEFSGGVEAVASNGGQLMPPIMGVVVFVMSGITGLSYGKVCLAALFPAILYYLALFIQVDLEAATNRLKGVPKSELPSMKKVLTEGWQYLVPLISLVVFLIVLGFSPERAGLNAIIILILVCWTSKATRVSLYRLIVSLHNAATAMCVVGIACALAGLIIGSIAVVGTGTSLAIGLVNLSGGHLIILVGLTAIACFILGMGMTSVAIYMMLASLISPALIQMDVPLIAAHLFVVYWGLTSFITPPVCITVYVASALAESKPMRTGWIATRLGICNYVVPLLFVYKPALLLVGERNEIVAAITSSLLGITLLAVGLGGYLFKRLNWMMRIGFFIASFLLMITGWISGIIGMAIALILLLWLIKKKEISQDKEVYAI